jgi:hypothetical protein
MQVGSGSTFTPPGWTHNGIGQSHSTWGTNSTTGVQPPGWSQNSTSQTNAGWSGTLGGTVPPGLGLTTPGH